MFDWAEFYRVKDPALVLWVLLLIGFEPWSSVHSQMLKPARSTNQPTLESADDFVIFDPKPPAPILKSSNQATGKADPASTLGLMPITVQGSTSKAPFPLSPSPDKPTLRVETNPQHPELDDLLSADQERNSVVAEFTIPGPDRSPNSVTNSVGSARPVTADMAENEIAQPASIPKEPGSEASFLETLKAEDFFQVAASPYRHYRSSEARLTHLAASAGSFGWTSQEWEPYLKRDQANGLTGCIQNHFLSGPRNVDLPPRLHDFILGYQHRGTFNDQFSFDCGASVGVYSDFRGSAREGIRFPAHAVGIIHASHRTDFVFGVDYLDRKDYKILPVIGISCHDLNWTSLRYDLVFPRPRIDYTINDGTRIYLAGQLGGGTWDFEFPNGTGGVMNYRDFRVLLGREKRYLDGSRQAIEFGYVFGRELTLQDVPGEFDFRNAILIRMLSRY